MTLWDSPTKILVIVLVAAVLFGYKRLPEMSRSVGRSLRIFKSEMKGMNDDDAARNVAKGQASAAPTQSGSAQQDRPDEPGKSTES